MTQEDHMTQINLTAIETEGEADGAESVAESVREADSAEVATVFEARSFQTRKCCELYFLEHIPSGACWYPDAGAGQERMCAAKKAPEGVGLALLDDLLRNGGGYWVRGEDPVPAVDLSL